MIRWYLWWWWGWGWWWWWWSPWGKPPSAPGACWSAERSGWPGPDPRSRACSHDQGWWLWRKYCNYDPDDKDEENIDDKIPWKPIIFPFVLTLKTVQHRAHLIRLISNKHRLGQNQTENCDDDYTDVIAYNGDKEVHYEGFWTKLWWQQWECGDLLSSFVEVETCRHQLMSLLSPDQGHSQNYFHRFCNYNDHHQN